ncbi:hypothetical protein SAMN05518672_103582 [Chitinophaga sp. CF118]|nr:hypothetical protein SAMN05518672_103582 [Chitinophaga sp. CF118]
MGPWVHVCERCARKSYFQLSDMLLPQVACSHCGHVKIISTETIARTREALDQHKWYAGFLELIKYGQCHESNCLLKYFDNWGYRLASW